MTAFQCSSASRKFLNRCVYSSTPQTRLRFSALQRAENSSIRRSAPASRLTLEFQCSSASRKFLNSESRRTNPRLRRRFSALQRAENSSIRRRYRREAAAGRVSVLFSEPKIPQSSAPARWRACCTVSVLFSEPKIPQSRPSHLRPSIFPTAMITLRHS